MPADLARVALITQEFRWDVQLDLAVPGRHPQARSDDNAPSYCTNAAGAATINSAIFSLLSGDNQLLEIEIDPLPEIDFSQMSPEASLVYDPLGLTRTCVIVGCASVMKSDGSEVGTLLLW